MKHSEQINEIATALAKAQGEMRTVTKDKRANAGKYGYTYASFAAVVESIIGPLSRNGLSFAQTFDQTDKSVTVTSRVLHTSGQWIEGNCTIPVAGNNAQAVGSAITYGRRYGLCSLVGVVADDDDDAQEAQRNPPSTKTLNDAIKKAQPQTIADLFVAKINACDSLKNLEELGKKAPTDAMSDNERAVAKAAFSRRKAILAAKEIGGEIVDQKQTQSRESKS